MTGRVNDGDLVTLAPCDASTLNANDVVLVKVRGTVYLHLIKSIDSEGRFLIGNNRGGINGWVGPSAVYGIATSIESFVCGTRREPREGETRRPRGKRRSRK